VQEAGWGRGLAAKPQAHVAKPRAALPAAERLARTDLLHKLKMTGGKTAR